MLRRTFLQINNIINNNINNINSSRSRSNRIVGNLMIRHFSNNKDNNKIFAKLSDIPDEDVLEFMKEDEEKDRKKEARRWARCGQARDLQISFKESDFDQLDAEIEALKKGETILKWNTSDKRTGLLAIKVGMMPLWDDWGERHACTVLFVDRNKVLEVKNQEKHGYDAVVLGAGLAKTKRVNSPKMGFYKKLGLESSPPEIVREFRITSPVLTVAGLNVGQELHARHFVVGQNVDVSAISKGKGFQGGMKRHNFAGMPASHGVSKSHRSIGSTGQCQDPGRVFKGKKMPGRMGAERVTTQNLRIVKIDRGRNLLFVKGCVPGQNGRFVEVKDAIKRPLWGTDKVEGGAQLPPLPTFEFDPSIDGSGEIGQELFMPIGDVDPLLPEDSMLA